MSPNMTGRTTIEYIPDPAAASESSLCYELKWPQGRHSRCASGSISISTDGGLLAKTTIYDVSMYPNSFTLHVWTGSGPDTAKAHVFVETHVA